MRSLVGLAGRLIGMLSGLLAPPALDAASGDLAIGAWLSGGALGAVCATAFAPLARSAASAVPAAVAAVHLPRFISFSFDVACRRSTGGFGHTCLASSRPCSGGAIAGAMNRPLTCGRARHDGSRRQFPASALHAAGSSA